jgi:hypothetical protein
MDTLPTVPADQGNCQLPTYPLASPLTPHPSLSRIKLIFNRFVGILARVL